MACKFLSVLLLARGSQQVTSDVMMLWFDTHIHPRSPPKKNLCLPRFHTSQGCSASEQFQRIRQSFGRRLCRQLEGKTTPEAFHLLRSDFQSTAQRWMLHRVDPAKKYLIEHCGRTVSQHPYKRPPASFGCSPEPQPKENTSAAKTRGLCPKSRAKADET